MALGSAASQLYEEIVDAINAIYGSHAGSRAVHAKGTVLAGTFTATAEAARLSRAPHLQGDTHRATVRFSNGGGDPNAPDAAVDGRGMAVKVYLPGGGTTDIVSISRPTFLARTPEDFLELMHARRPDPETGQPDGERIGMYLQKHPEALASIQAILSAGAPESYARLRYFAVHAFGFVDANGERRAFRYQWIPEAGEATLSDEDAQSSPRDYLQTEIAERVAEGPVAFTLAAQLAEDGDPEDDPTEAWPDERERVEIGRLEITGPETERETGDDVLVFDPTRVPDGIELSADPILRARPHAYAVSVERRSGVRREPA